MLMPEVELKKCTKCPETNTDNFYKSKRYSDGLYPCCKKCWQEYTSTPKAKKRRNETNIKNEIGLKRLETLRKWQLKKKYDITPEDYSKMFNEQDGKCAICSKLAIECHNGLYVDHCHKTKKVRGLLCKDCNAAIGLLKEDTNVIKNAIKYLNKGAKNV